MLAISPFWAMNDVGPGVSWLSSQSVSPALLLDPEGVQCRPVCPPNTALPRVENSRSRSRGGPHAGAPMTGGETRWGIWHHLTHSKCRSVDLWLNGDLTMVKHIWGCSWFEAATHGDLNREKWWFCMVLWNFSAHECGQQRWEYWQEHSEVRYMGQRCGYASVRSTGNI